MSGRILSDPSPWRIGIMHGVISFSVFSGALGVAGLGVHVTGNVQDAGPMAELNLFEPRNNSDRSLKTDEADITLATLQPRNESVFQQGPAPTPEQILISDSAGIEIDPSPAARRPVAPEAVRINGKLVPAGRSLSEVSAEIELARAPFSGLYESRNGARLPIIAEDGRRPDRAYARPVQNPEGRPTVSIIVGGLGINWTTTMAAIRDLPPEVTLSFVPHSRSLQTLVRNARAEGHEVLIELPMEGYDQGRGRPPANQLTTGETDQNGARLLNLLGSTTGYFGVVNYKGNKFAQDSAAVGPVMEVLAERGVAFVEDGSLSDGVFSLHAQQHGAAFGQSDLVIDADRDANAIDAKLFELETAARQSGAAMGTGFAFPLTVDTIKSWAEGLEDRGLVLVPASSQTFIAPTRQTADLPTTGSGGAQ